MDRGNKVKTVATKKKTENSMNHLSNGKNHVNAKFSVASKWDESGRDGTRGKESVLTQLITLRGKIGREKTKVKVKQQHYCSSEFSD